MIRPKEPPSLKLVGHEQPEADDGRFKRVGSFLHDAERPTHLSWSRYCDWRKSKCPDVRTRSPITELTNATLELVGEIAELTVLFAEHGHHAFAEASLFARAFQEAGNVIFTACWALDAWGHNMLRLRSDESGTELLSEEHLQEELALHDFCLRYLVDKKEDDADSNQKAGAAAIAFERFSLYFLAVASANFGMTANALKKQLFHQTPAHDPRIQAEHIIVGLGAIQRLGVLMGVPLSGFMEENIKKLDERFPDGYSVGGDIRPAK